MMNWFVAVSLCMLSGSFPIAAIAAPQGWTAIPYSEDGGQSFRAAEGDEASTVLVLSLADISKMSGRDADDLIAEFDADPQEALEFALSVMWIDIDEAEPLTKTQDGAPLLIGDGFTEFGERRFAIGARGEGADRNVIALIALTEDFDALGGAAFLDQGWLDAGAATHPPCPKGGNQYPPLKLQQRPSALTSRRCLIKIWRLGRRMESSGSASFPATSPARVT